MAEELKVSKEFVEECRNKDCALFNIPTQQFLEAISTVVESMPESPEKKALLATWEDDGDLTRAAALLSITEPENRGRSGVWTIAELVRDRILSPQFSIMSDVEELLMPEPRKR